MDRRQHWERVYASRGERDTSWFEATPGVSLRLMEAAGLTPNTCVLDVGCGQSRLIEALARRGLTCLAGLDVSSTALSRAREDMGEAAHIPVWIASDVTGAWSVKPMDIWHDRAVFHFLTDAGDRARYLQHLEETLTPNGTAIIATFALDGPETCSGLPVSRYSPETLAVELGSAFTLVESLPHVHVTPRGASQSFQYSRFVHARCEVEGRGFSPGQAMG